MKALNLYAGLGGNRRLWEGADVVAVELQPEIAEQYHRLYPKDTLVVGDAHDFLEKHYADFDFIWSSPPCQSHSRAAARGHNQTPRYADMKLWQEIIFLQQHCQCPWVVENVKSYYQPFITPQMVGRHAFWSNFHISSPHIDVPLFDATRGSLTEWLGFDYEGNYYYDGNHDPLQILRNCVHPEIGKAVFDSAFNQADFIGMQESIF